LSGMTGCPDPLPDAAIAAGPAGLLTALPTDADVETPAAIGFAFFSPCILSVLSFRSCSCASFCALSRSTALLLLADVIGNARRDDAMACGVRVSGVEWPSCQGCSGAGISYATRPPRTRHTAHTMPSSREIVTGSPDPTVFSSRAQTSSGKRTKKAGRLASEPATATWVVPAGRGIVLSVLEDKARCGEAMWKRPSCV